MIRADQVKAASTTAKDQSNLINEQQANKGNCTLDSPTMLTYRFAIVSIALGVSCLIIVRLSILIVLRFNLAHTRTSTGAISTIHSGAASGSCSPITGRGASSSTLLLLLPQSGGDLLEASAEAQQWVSTNSAVLFRATQIGACRDKVKRAR